MRGSPENKIERLRLELEDLVVIDEALRVERLGSCAKRLEVRRASLGAGDLLDANVGRVQKAPRRRVVGRGLVRNHRDLRSEWVEERHRRAFAPRPARKVAQVREVADAPTVPRARRVELDRPAPDALGCGRAGPLRQLATRHPGRTFGLRPESREHRLDRFRGRDDALAPVAEVFRNHTPSLSAINHALQASIVAVVGRLYHVPSEACTSATAQTSGMTRMAALSGETVGSRALWMGETHVAPRAPSVPHHDGKGVTQIYGGAGHLRFIYSDDAHEVRPTTKASGYI